MNVFGLIGYPLGHSFSKQYFTQKFKQLQLKDYCYNLYELATIKGLPFLLESEPDLKGLNVTIPYKIDVFPYLHRIEESAQKIGAVNVIKIDKKFNQTILTGYNSDIYGFEISFKRLLNNERPQALILGTGGAAQAVSFVLKNLNIKHHFVSRSNDKADFTYKEITHDILQQHLIVINCTPAGTYPNVDETPPIPYESLTSSHLLYDLVYNPLETKFLNNGKKQGAKIQNGLTMLHLQAERAWAIWQGNI